jgi:hypothetical protein
VRRFTLIAIPVAVLAMSGCGNTKKTEKANRAHPRVSSRNSACERAGISSEPYREGSCVESGITITVADRAHWLHGTDYDARFLNLRRITTLEGRSGNPLRAHGTFVVVELRIKNKSLAPHVFDPSSNLVFLLVDQKRFSESRVAETDPLLKPFALGAALQPDEVATGTVVFDLPLEHAKNVLARGSDLIFVNFGDEGVTAASLKPGSGRLGFVRLWK